MGKRDAEPAVRSTGWIRVVEELLGCVENCEQRGLGVGHSGPKKEAMWCVWKGKRDWQEEEGERSVAARVGGSILDLWKGNEG